MPKDFKKYYVVKAPPSEIYMALTNAKSITLWTDDETEMGTEPNTEFSLWGGSICGMNLEFEENRKIVQEWYFGKQEEKSIVTIILHPHKKGTSVELKHTNIPDAEYEEFTDGWDHAYFSQVKEFVEEDGLD
ncbi:MAG: SRPBCC domain-containing protein [Bacteroidetes bacterium]|jgi:activator of HSP90 ATPase|nr:SRPBCC domain-containing protein [Bacteroidota bacterium]